MQIKEMQKKAERLARLRSKVDDLKKKFTDKLSPLEEQRDALQMELLEDMSREQVASLRIENGDMYTRATRKGITITNEVFARKWALENNAFSIDRKQVAGILGKKDELPPGFEKTETAYITIRKSN